MAEDKAPALKEAQKECKEFTKNTNYKRGDSINLGGITLWARCDFKSTDIFDPRNWSNTDTTPKDTIILYFTPPATLDRPATREESKPIEIDITDILKEKLKTEDVRKISRAFRGLIGTTENEDGTVGSTTARASLDFNDSEGLYNRVKRISETSIVNQKQLESVNSLLFREINDFFNSAFRDFWF